MTMTPIERKARELLAAHGPDRWWYPTLAHPDEYIGWKYGDTWDNLKDARESYEGLADAYMELREIVEAITALTPPAGGLPEVPEPFMDLHRDLTPVIYDAWAAQPGGASHE